MVVIFGGSLFRIRTFLLSALHDEDMRTSPLSGLLWQRLIIEGEVRCRGCDTMVNLDEADEINDAVGIWNTHVQDCPEAEPDGERTNP